MAEQHKGFSLVELVVVLTILSLFIGLGYPSIQAYYKSTGYQTVKNRAETIFYSAQNALSMMSGSSQLYLYQQRLLNYSTSADAFMFPYLSKVDDDPARTRYFMIQIEKGAYDSLLPQDLLVKDLLNPYILDPTIWEASIALEIDTYTNTVQSVFYTTSQTTFDYGTGTGVSIINRDIEVLQQLRLGMMQSDATLKSLALGVNVTVTLPEPPQDPEDPESIVDPFLRIFSTAIKTSAVNYEFFLEKNESWANVVRREYKPDNWNGYLEMLLEKGESVSTRRVAADEGNNKINYSNPVSEKRAVFDAKDWNKINKDYKSYLPPAIIITNDKELAPSSSYIAKNVDTLKGSIVIYKEDKDKVEKTVVYYVYEDGTISDPISLFDILS